MKKTYTLFFIKGNPSLEDCDAAVLGVAFDGNASYGKGAAEAPEAIMKASLQMDIENPMTGKTLEIAIHNFGITEPKDAKEMIGETAKIAEKALEAGKFFILLGGDHSTVNGILNAVPKDACFVNFDAHLDGDDDNPFLRREEIVDGRTVGRAVHDFRRTGIHGALCGHGHLAGSRVSLAAGIDDRSGDCYVRGTSRLSAPQRYLEFPRRIQLAARLDGFFES